jgi:hypothetical protein
MLFNLKEKKRKKTFLDSFRGGFAPFVFSPEALLYFNRFDIQPPLAVRKELAKFIDGLVSDGIYAKLDEFWIYAINTSHNALLGVKNYKNCSVLGGMAFTTNRGFAGDFSNKALDTNYIPSVDKINFDLNSGSIGVYNRVSSASNRVDIGCQNASSNVLALISGSTLVTNFKVAFNSISFFSIGVLGSNTLGLIASVRTAANNVRTYKTGSFLNQALNNSGIPSVRLYVGANNNNGSLASATNNEYCFAFVGGLLTDANVISIATRLEIYLDYIGAGVMP